MITPNTPMCKSDSVYLSPAPLKPYQNNVFTRLVYAPAKQSTRDGAEQALKIKSRGVKC